MKKSIKIALVAILAVLVVAGSLVAVFWDNVTNFVAKTTKSPEEYYLHVEKENLDLTTSMLYEVLNVEAFEKGIKTGGDYSFKVELGDGIYDVADYVLGADSKEYIEWLKSVELYGSANGSTNKADVTDSVVKLGLNGKEIVSASITLDGNGNYYFSIPLLTGDKSIKITSEDIKELYGTSDDLMSSSSILDVVYEDNFYEDFLKAIPSEEVFGKLLNKYFEIIVNNLGEATKESADLTIDGVTQSCTLLKISISETDVVNAAKAVLTEAKSDEEIKKTIKAVAAEFTEEDIYPEFIDAVNEALEEIEEFNNAKEKSESESEETVYYKAWVDNKGNIIARAIEAEDGKFFYGSVKDGSDVAVDVYFEEDSVKEFQFSGKGTLKTGKLNGDFVLEVEGEEYAKINVKDFDLAALKKDKVVYGEFTFSLGSYLADELGVDRKSTRLNSSHKRLSRMPSSA